MSEKKKSFDLQLFARVLTEAAPYKKLFSFCIFLAVILAPISNIRPYLVKVMVDDHILKDDMAGLKTIAIIYIVVVLVNAPLRYIFIYSTAKLGQNVVRDLRNKVFKHINSLYLRYFDQTPVGKSTTRTINDIQAINEVFTQGTMNIVADMLGLFAVIGIMFYTSWRLALICLMVMPLLIIATYIFKEKVKSAFQKVRTQLTQMNTFLQERISGMREVQILSAEEQELNKYRKINKAYTQANLDGILYYAVFFPVVELISAVALAGLVWWGSGSYLEGKVSFGALVAFPMFLSMMFRPVRLLADKFNTLQMGLVAADRVFEVIDTNTKIRDEGKIKPEKLKGYIQFDNVNFSYDDENLVLKDLSFDLNPGETLAIVGSTGSGKTSIINVLFRFYEIQSGQVKVDETDIRKYHLDAYRSNFALVLQDVFLFTGTIYENISLRSETISKEQVIETAKIIGAHTFIEQLPNGYDFMISERGSNLSAGLKQLISFVRALVVNPDILILDEATSSIDSETESIIQHAIEKLIDKRTSIIIAHRLSTVSHADKIIVLDKGRIVESGDHQSLLTIGDGHYRKLYEMQFAENIS